MCGLVLGLFIWQHFGAGPGAVTGSAYILINYIEKIADLFFQFTGSYSDVIKYRTRVTNAEELSTDFASESFSNHVLPKNWQRLEVSHLSFSYHNEVDANLHLHDVSFSVTHGERVALVGETGSGKSTFLKIMRDLYHPKELILRVDGQIIPQGFEGISRAMSLAQQDPEIFAKTILNNITMGAEHDLDFVMKFSDMACFTDVVQCLPKQFDSSIKEKGLIFPADNSNVSHCRVGFLPAMTKISYSLMNQRVVSIPSQKSESTRISFGSSKVRQSSQQFISFIFSHSSTVSVYSIRERSSPTVHLQNFYRLVRSLSPFGKRCNGPQRENLFSQINQIHV